MAALHYAAGAATTLRRGHRRFIPQTPDPRKEILLISSSFTSFPAKPTRRKNHLRQKILKTRERPIVPKLPPSNPIIPVKSPPFQENEPNSGEIQETRESESSEAGNEEIVPNCEELKEIEIFSNPAVVSVDTSSGNNSVFNFGFWLVGAFVFQIVYAVWAFSSAGNRNKFLNGNEKSPVIEVGGNGNGNGNGEKMGVENSSLDSIDYVDELEMQRKIEEIRMMAREAREAEKLGLKKNGFEDIDEIEGGKYLKNGIDGEVNDRLIKLRNKLEKARGKIPVASVEYLKNQNKMNDGVEKAGFDERDINGELLFKKKYKFKGNSGNLKEKPKGFTGSKMNGSSKNTTKKVRKERGTGKRGKGNGFSKTKVATDELSKVNDNLEGERVRHATSAQKRESGPDLWWLSLPYVVVIVMRRGGDDGEVGLYTLKSISSTDDHIVAFEDRADASNFCYLLGSFFKDLEGFDGLDTDVVPVTVEELNEAMRLYTMKVVVVKRGQLRLYAGQPLAVAEAALRAMM